MINTQAAADFTKVLGSLIPKFDQSCRILATLNKRRFAILTKWNTAYLKNKLPAKSAAISAPIVPQKEVDEYYTLVVSKEKQILPILKLGLENMMSALKVAEDFIHSVKMSEEINEMITVYANVCAQAQEIVRRLEEDILYTEVRLLNKLKTSFESDRKQIVEFSEFILAEQELMAQQISKMNISLNVRARTEKKLEEINTLLIELSKKVAGSSGVDAIMYIRSIAKQAAANKNSFEMQLRLNEGNDRASKEQRKTAEQISWIVSSLVGLGVPSLLYALYGESIKPNEYLIMIPTYSLTIAIGIKIRKSLANMFNTVFDYAPSF